MVSFLSTLRAIVVDQAARGTLLVGGFCLCCLVTVFSCISVTKSMMLTAYACMCIFDLFVVGTSLVAIWVKQQQQLAQLQSPNQPSGLDPFTYGYERFEVLCIFASSVLAILSSLFVVKESLERLLQQPEIHTGSYLLGTCAALAGHLVIIYVLRNEAFRHVINAAGSSWLQEHMTDISQTVCRYVPPLSTLLLPRINPLALLAGSGATACVVGHFLVDYEQYYAADTVCALCFAGMLVGTMYPMALYTGKILLQATPSHLVGQLDKSLREASTLDGVLEFTHDHFWQLSFGQLTGSVHFRIRRDADEQLVLAHIIDKLSPVVPELSVQVTKDAGWYNLSTSAGAMGGMVGSASAVELRM